MEGLVEPAEFCGANQVSGLGMYRPASPQCNQR